MEDNVSLPHNLDAERAVLSAMLLGAHSFSNIHEYLKSEDFFRESHAKLFETIMEMIQAQKPVDGTSVIQYAIHTQRVESLGGIGYLTTLYSQTGSSYNVEYYAEIVKEQSVRRRLVQNSLEVLKMARNGQEDIDTVLEFAEKKIFEVTQSADNKDWQPIAQIVGDEFVRIQELMGKNSDFTGMDTGFIDLNEILSGLQRTDLVILAARPAMGKTALALNIALNVSKSGPAVGVFSLEMSAGQLVTRLLCMEGPLHAEAVRKGRLTVEEDIPKLTSAAERLFDLPIYIDDTSGLTITQLRSKSRRLKATNPNLGLIVVDYIGLMPGDKNLSRQEQVSEASRGLKQLAKELNVCVMALSQLNRGVESRTDKRPVPSDLRESGAIEQDADIISFIYRDEYYNKESPDKGVAEVIIAKQRNGSTGTVKLHFEGQHTRFFNLAKQTEDVHYL